MKKLLLYVLFFCVASACSFTQAYGQNTDLAAGFSLLQNFPDPFEKSTTIKFNLTEDCYVKLFVINLRTGKQSLLVDGEVGAGNQGIIFNAYNRIISEKESNATFICKMEIYSLGENTLIYSSEIKMRQK